MRNFAEGLGRAEGLDRIGNPVADAIKKVLKPGAVKDLLSGTWLGHPLHPVLTDVPLGAWVSSLFLDLFGGKRARGASDALLRVAGVTAIPTAVAGVSDWVDTVEEERRVGVVHAAGNTLALGFLVGSLRARRKGRRARGVLLSMLGQGVATVSAYLGGHLSFGKGVGVDQTAFEQGPKEWVAVMEGGALSDEKPAVASLDGGIDVLLYRTNGRIYAISNRCNHRACPLSDGDVEELNVICPCHGSTFRLTDGGVVQGPATGPQPAYDAREHDGRIEVKLREG
jgi:nitrite reductase/ring-hydroxylating ferredoxin subunit/uncharacterized membrane protein